MAGRALFPLSDLLEEWRCAAHAEDTAVLKWTFQRGVGFVAINGRIEFIEAWK
jgi:hypothetical protein